MRVTPSPLLQGSGCGFASAGRSGWRLRKSPVLEARPCAQVGLRQSCLQLRLPQPDCFLLLLPHRGFRSVPLFCFCIWFCDSFKDTNMPQNSHQSQPSLSCCPLTVIANICLTRCSFAFVNTLSSFTSQINMILPLSFQVLPSSHMSGQISDLQTHTHKRTHVHREQR